MRMKLIYLLVLLCILCAGAIIYVVVEQYTETAKEKEAVSLEHHERAIHPHDCNLDPVMTNDEIITETKYCESIGMRAITFHCGGDKPGGLIIYVQCAPK